MGTADVVELTSALVAIDSVNPSLEPGAAGEAEVAAYVASWAQSAGLEAEVHERTAGRPSVVVRARGRGGGSTLLLCGHLDTVGVEGMADGHAPRVDGDRLHGRGAYDMKAGVAAALVACREAASRELAGDVVVAAVADEEYASVGVREVLSALGGPPAAAAVVTEPTQMEIAVAHRGFAWLEVEVTGKAAHGSRPDLGVDAIAKAGSILTGVGDWDRRLAESGHPLLGRGSVHASLVSGGRDLATYPERARPASSAGRCRAKDSGRSRLSSTRCSMSAAAWTRSWWLRRARCWCATRSRHRRMHRSSPPYRRAGTRVLGSPPPTVGASFWADSAFIAAAGIPTVLFGPGGEGAHADVEWVSIRDTIACAEAS